MKQMISGKIWLYDESTGQRVPVDILRGESAYEAAVRLGLTTMTEEQWTQEYVTKRDEAVQAIEEKGQETLAKIPGGYTELAENVGQLSADIKKAVAFPENYWTEGEIAVEPTGAWANKTVYCPAIIPNTVKRLKITLENISDTTDEHKIYVSVANAEKTDFANVVLQDTFVDHVAQNGGYVLINVEGIQGDIAYIKVQAQAYSGNTPTVTADIVYTISASDYDAKPKIIATVDENSLDTALKGKLGVGVNRTITQNRDELNAGDIIVLGNNDVKKNKKLVFTCRVESFTQGIVIRHGDSSDYGRAELKLTPTQLTVNDKTVEHGLAIENDLYIEISNRVSKYGFHAAIKIVSNGATYANTSTYEFPWLGSNGNIAITAGYNTTIKNAVAAWTCTDFEAPIFAYGDSYFDYWNPKVADLGYADYFLLDGYGGRRCIPAIESLDFCLEHGTPKAVLWCLGMNDPDDGSVNANWLTAYNTVAGTCEKKGIDLILCTIPNTPTNDNQHKNTFIRASGHRYVDIAKYVGSDEDVNWYTGLLGSDNIHPTDKGSYAIAQYLVAELYDVIN